MTRTGRWPRRSGRQWLRGVSALLGVGGWIVVGVALVGLIGPLLLSADPLTTSPDILAPPSAQHLFGTDDSGRDVFARTVYAARLDLFIALSSALLSAVVGSVYGAVAGYSRSALGGTMTRSLDVLQSFPLFIFAMMLVVFSGRSTLTIIIAIAFVNAPVFARLARATTLSLRDKPFVKAAICAGASRTRVIVRHILPNFSGQGMEQLTTTTGWAIIITAGLSFVGAGIRPPTPEWGSMVSVGAESLISGYWWTSVFPGAAILLTVLGLTLWGGRLNRALDPYRT